VYLGLKPEVGPPAYLRPSGALEYAREHGLTDGPVYNAYDFGGYLISQHIPTFIDGRGVLFGDMLADYFFPSAVRFDKAIERYHVTWALVAPTSSVAKHLDAHWHKLYEDETAAVYEKPP
jgi:hypothetical protein